MYYKGKRGEKQVK
jgi:hypothetical protein